MSRIPLEVVKTYFMVFFMKLWIDALWDNSWDSSREVLWDYKGLTINGQNSISSPTTRSIWGVYDTMQVYAKGARPSARRRSRVALFAVVWLLAPAFLDAVPPCFKSRRDLASARCHGTYYKAKSWPPFLFYYSPAVFSRSLPRYRSRLVAKQRLPSGKAITLVSWENKNVLKLNAARDQRAPEVV